MSKSTKEHIYNNRNNYEKLKNEFDQIYLYKYDQNKLFPTKEELQELKSVDDVHAYTYKSK